MTEWCVGAVAHCNQSRGCVSFKKQTAPIGVGAVYELITLRRRLLISTIATSAIRFNPFARCYVR